VLHQLGLIRTDELPDLASRWLAADMVDTESVRILAGHTKHDPWALEHLLDLAAPRPVAGVPRTRQRVIHRGPGPPRRGRGGEEQRAAGGGCGPAHLDLAQAARWAAARRAGPAMR